MLNSLKYSTCGVITLCFPQVASYGVKPKYGLVTYATDAKTLIRVSDAESSDAVWVTEKLNKISYEGQKSEGNGGKFILRSQGSGVL